MTPAQLIDVIHTPFAQEFLQEHRNEDLTSLLFKFGKDELAKALISQLIQRKKMSSKLPEWTENPYIILPLNVSSEQSSSEASARLKASLVKGVKLLDVTGGMGVDTYYLSSSFKTTDYIEQQSDLAKITSHNFDVLKAKNIDVYSKDGIAALHNSNADFIYADPARRDKNKSKVHQLEDYEPDLLPYLPQIIKDERHCLIKTSPMLDISRAVSQLQFVKEVWVISHKNDCKEVCFLLNASYQNNFLLRTFNITNFSVEEFNFYSNDSSLPPLANKLGDYLYEPNASIQKSNGVDLIAAAFNLEKLHPNTNILSGGWKENFPGKSFKVNEILKPYHPDLRKKRLNVISRNYPDKASVIEKKLQLKGSEKEYLLALKLADGSYKFIHATLQHRLQS